MTTSVPRSIGSRLPSRIKAFLGYASTLVVLASGRPAALVPVYVPVLAHRRRR